MTKDQFLHVLHNVPDLDEASRARLACALLGHSAIVEMCFGQVTCARCDALLGDTIGGCFDLRDKVIRGHACEKCRKVFEGLGWQDRLYVRDPFVEDFGKEQKAPYLLEKLA